MDMNHLKSERVVILISTQLRLHDLKKMMENGERLFNISLPDGMGNMAVVGIQLFVFGVPLHQRAEGGDAGPAQLFIRIPDSFGEAVFFVEDLCALAHDIKQILHNGLRHGGFFGNGTAFAVQHEDVFRHMHRI